MRVGRCVPLSLSLSRLLVSWTKIQGAPASSTRRCASLPWFTDPHISPPSPPLPPTPCHTRSFPYLVHFSLEEAAARIHCAPSSACTHACMHACTRARAWLREPYNFYGDIIWSTLFANRPLARLVTPVIAIIDSLNRARGSDGHLLRPPVYQSRTSIRNDSNLSFFAFFPLSSLVPWIIVRVKIIIINSFFLSLAIKLILEDVERFFYLETEIQFRYARIVAEY